MANLAPADSRSLRSIRYLRVLTLIPAIWLLGAIFVVWLRRREILPSISDYYGGPLRDVFVGGLMACGLAMVIYVGGSKLEEYALNFAGVNAFFVALVPNSFQDLIAQARDAEVRGVEIATSSQMLLQNLKIALATFLVVVIAVVIIDFFVMKWTRFAWADQSPLANGLIVASWVLEALVVAGLIGILLGVEDIAGASLFTIFHFMAASFLVLNLSFAAASHAWSGRLRLVASGDDLPDTLTAQRLFKIITVAMWVGIVVGGVAIRLKVPTAVFWTEVYEIVMFCVFWFISTRESWVPSDDWDAGN